MQKKKLKEFIQDKKNFNNHTEIGMASLEKSVNSVGIIEAITVTNDNVIISGNARQQVIEQVIPDKEAIIVETDGSTPVVIKRTDIESNTEQFYKAAALANTVAKLNIELDEVKMTEILVQDLGVSLEDVAYYEKTDNKKETSNKDENNEDEDMKVTITLGIHQQEKAAQLMNKLAITSIEDLFLYLLKTKNI